MQQHLHRWFFYKQETACQKPEKLKKKTKKGTIPQLLRVICVAAKLSSTLNLCLPYIGSSNEEQEAAMIETLKAEEY
jgi:hypothetical protein